MLIPAGVKVHLALGYTDLRKGIDGLGVLVERVLEQDPFSDTTLPRAGAHFEDAHRRLLVDAGALLHGSTSGRSQAPAATFT